MTKKKILLLITLCLITHGMLFSQTEEEKYAPFQLSFVPPLSTNGLQAAQYTNGASLNVLLGVSKNETGFALGGIANVMTNNASGLQIAGLANYAGNEVDGVWLSGLINIVGNSHTGIQIAGLVNTAKDVSGIQIAGLVNVAEKVTGVQVGGLLNIAEESDYPVGLINLIRNGEKSVSITYNEIGSSVISFRSGGKHTYGIVGIGYNHKATAHSFVIETGIGLHTNINPWFRINHELRNEFIGRITGSNRTDKVGYYLLPAFRIASHLEIFGGVSVNYMETKNSKHMDLFPGHSLWDRQVSSKLQQVFIGYQAGVQYLF
ncbi:MAG: hypothetical protein LBL58_17505 [Tannerellaceae bacterium]|jgi:hypothetical protein|nr:hypothetical protein [Tannerellaceae bacterium]